jgi:hypothetical protein
MKQGNMDFQARNKGKVKPTQESQEEMEMDWRIMNRLNWSISRREREERQTMIVDNVDGHSIPQMSVSNS